MEPQDLRTIDVHMVHPAVYQWDMIQRLANTQPGYNIRYQFSKDIEQAVKNLNGEQIAIYSRDDFRGRDIVNLNVGDIPEILKNASIGELVVGSWGYDRDNTEYIIKPDFRINKEMADATFPELQKSVVREYQKLLKE